MPLVYIILFCVHFKPKQTVLHNFAYVNICTRITNKKQNYKTAVTRKLHNKYH